MCVGVCVCSSLTKKGNLILIEMFSYQNCGKVSDLLASVLTDTWLKCGGICSAVSDSLQTHGL